MDKGQKQGEAIFWNRVQCKVVSVEESSKKVDCNGMNNIAQSPIVYMLLCQKRSTKYIKAKLIHKHLIKLFN